MNLIQNTGRNKKTNVEHLFYIPLMEDTTRVSALRTGDVDIIDSIPTESIEVLGIRRIKHS